MNSRKAAYWRRRRTVRPSLRDGHVRPADFGLEHAQPPDADRHPDGLPELFLDRSLGRRQIPDLLRASGLRLRTLSEVYGIPADEDVADVDWLKLVGALPPPGSSTARVLPMECRRP